MSRHPPTKGIPAGSITTPADRFAFVLATWFGCGLSPIAPGTCGALGAVPLHFLLCRLPIAVHASVIVVLSAIGIWVSQRVAVVLNREDPQLVVIDEVAGVLIAMAAVRTFGTVPIVAAFLLFRFFDITKIGPIGRAEQWEPPGLGIMADDLLAGVAAAIVARLGVLLWMGL